MVGTDTRIPGNVRRGGLGPVVQRGLSRKPQYDPLFRSANALGAHPALYELTARGREHPLFFVRTTAEHRVNVMLVNRRFDQIAVFEEVIEQDEHAVWESNAVAFRKACKEKQESALKITVTSIQHTDVGLVLKHCLTVDFTAVVTRVTVRTECNQIIEGVSSHLNPRGDVSDLGRCRMTCWNRAAMPSFDEHSSPQLHGHRRASFGHRRILFTQIDDGDHALVIGSSNAPPNVVTLLRIHLWFALRVRESAH